MLWCEMCAETFECEDDWGEHMDECGHWPQCETCSLLFETQLDCHEHMNEADHWAQRFECETCPRAFLSMEAADHHMNVSGHWHPRIGCETCQIKFFTQSSANRHMDIAGHWAPRFGCDSCNKMFRSQEVANQHMTAAGHRAARVGGVHFEIPAQSRKLAVVDQNKLQSPPKTVKTPKSIQTTKTTCPKCGRQFQDENSLKMHLNSKVHQGSTVPCPFCKTPYTIASGLCHHLETASCPRAPKLNRDTIHRMVQELDPNGAITTKQIKGPSDDSKQYFASKFAFNGQSWECYLCHRNFKAKQSLNQHLQSPIHKQSIYRCPNAQSVCGKQFSTLAGLFNHLESESCAFIRFEKVQSVASDVLQGRRLL